MFKQMTMQSPIGPLYIVSDGTSIIGVWMKGQKYFQASLKETPVKDEKDPVLKKAKKWFEDYFAGKKPSIKNLPLDPQGSPFRKKVWKELCKIPYGKTITYGEIAKRLEKNGKRVSAQAVGGAVGHNPISIIIPCHRVVGSDGSLTGYAGGISKKVKLLKHEEVDMRNLYVPKKGTAL